MGQGCEYESVSLGIELSELSFQLRTVSGTQDILYPVYQDFRWYLENEDDEVQAI